jgi:hypothetical protein
MLAVPMEMMPDVIDIAYLRELICEHTGRDLPIAITEINSSPTIVYGQPPSPDSFFNAIWYADVLGRLISEDVWMVNLWNISQRGGGLGLIKGFSIRPTLYTFRMYKHFGDQQVHAASGAEDVTVYAALRADGDGHQPGRRGADGDHRRGRADAHGGRGVAAGQRTQRREPG